MGVVMFVLALTILGLSLFNLSGYEAQSSRESLHEDAAFFAACSGLENAKFILARTESLDLVRDPSLFPAGVVYAVAKRTDTGDSLGSIDNLLAIHPVAIRVLADVDGSRRMVESNFYRSPVPNYYKKLFTANAGVYVKPFLEFNFDIIVPPVGDNIAPDSLDVCLGPLSSVRLQGDVWQTTTDESWRGCSVHLGSVSKSPIPIPDLVSFFAQYWNMAEDVSLTSKKYNLKNGGGTIPGGPSNVRFFRTLQDANSGSSTPNAFSVVAQDKVTIDVTNAGTVIWLLDHGFRLNEDVDINGGPGDCLVIVSKKCNLTVDPSDGKNYSNVGIWFFKGLQNTTVPLILATDGQARIEFGASFVGSSVNSYVSAFANDIWLKGPLPIPITVFPSTSFLGGSTMVLQHPVNHPLDQPKGLIDQLCELGALPNSISGIAFIRVAGTWKEWDPNNPPAF